MQSAISVLGQKVDAILSNQAETNDAVLKAQADTLDLIKAIDDETPVTAFRSPAAFVNKEPLNKAHSDGPTHGYIIAQLEALIEQKRATPQDMAMFETGGHLRKDLKEAIEASWFANKDKFK